MTKFTKETGALAGSKSRRGAEASVVTIRKVIEGNLDIDELFQEISQLDLQDRVNAKLRLLAFVLPKLANVDSRLTLIEDAPINAIFSVDLLNMPNHERKKYLDEHGYKNNDNE